MVPQLPPGEISPQTLLDAARVFEERIPFNRVLGLRIESLGEPDVIVRFEMRDELVGNFTRGSLHGGVISSVLDVVGGLVAFISLLKREGVQLHSGDGYFATRAQDKAFG